MWGNGEFAIQFEDDPFDEPLLYRLYSFEWRILFSVKEKKEPAGDVEMKQVEATKGAQSQSASASASTSASQGRGRASGRAWGCQGTKDNDIRDGSPRTTWAAPRR